jgi:hypothetical protein
MAEYENREHYIPLRKSDLVKMLLKDSKLDASEHDRFRQFCKLVSAVWHFEYYETLDQLKDSFAPFDPDSTCKPLEPLARDKRPGEMDKLFERFVGLMEKANFKRLSRKDVEAAIEGGASDWGINMNVDWEVFERLEVFVRGDVMTRRTKRGSIFFWKTETKEVETYQRVVLLLKLRKHKRLPSSIDVEGVFLKMFKDIPKVDLEMVLPGTSLQMPIMQKSKLGVSLIGTLGYGVFKVFQQVMTAVKELLGATLETATHAGGLLWGPVMLLGGYAYKQYAGYQTTKQNYAKMLTESLYFQNLDNNAGVITQVIDEAEEQECRETILAYYYLWKHAPSQGWNQGQLDDYIEMELEGKLSLKIDFEVDDAIAKLEKLQIVRKNGDNYVAVGIDEALKKLDHRWDHYFEYNNESGSAAVGAGGGRRGPWA